MSDIFNRPVELIPVEWDSELTDLIIDLEHFRRRRYGGTTPAPMFYELKALFHLLESLGSARLEGNRTAIAEIIEENINPKKGGKLDEGQQEIRNIENALQYIDEYILNGRKINDSFIREVHKKIVKDLTPPPDGEGDHTPGQYREVPVIITGSDLKPPASKVLVTSNMASLVSFIQADHVPKHALLKTAIAHHRFTAIHPFGNGNGRTVRALTYAMLLQQGFSVANAGRILNPTAIFCNDRSTYVAMLATADKGTNEDLLLWCEYVIKGLNTEIQKIDYLTDYKYVRKSILLPAVEDAIERKSISPEQAAILRLALRKKLPIKSSDIADIMPELNSLSRTRLIGKMVKLNLLKPAAENQRKYVISFSNSYLLRGVVEQLRLLGFIPGALT